MRDRDRGIQLVATLRVRLLNKILEAEMDTHLDYKKYERKPKAAQAGDGDGGGNSRNGYYERRLLMKDQDVAIKMPRDRKGEFEPVIVKKHETRFPELNEHIISLYSRG